MDTFFNQFSVEDEICNTEQKFHDWYCEAKIQKASEKEDLLVDVVKLLEDGFEEKQVKQKFVFLAKQEMQWIEKKKDFIILQSNNEKINTAGKKAKFDQEVFPECSTQLFDKKDEDDNSSDLYSIINVDEIYRLNLRQIDLKKQFGNDYEDY